MDLFLGIVFYVAISYTVGVVCDCLNMALKPSIIVGISWPISVPYLIVVWSRELIVSSRKS